MTHKTTITVYLSNDGYRYDLFSPADERKGVRCGKTAEEAVSRITNLLAKYKAQAIGACIVAPDEILAAIPQHLHDFEADKSQSIEEIMRILGALVRLVYNGDTPNNILRTILAQPLVGLGLMGKDMAACPNQTGIMILMGQLPDNLDEICRGTIPSVKQGTFWMGYYKHNHEKPQ